jgi:hypothetical protein
MIGYCATASSGIEIAPIRQMKSATTQAKIGLSMKKLGICPTEALGLLCGPTPIQPTHPHQPMPAV